MKRKVKELSHLFYLSELNNLLKGNFIVDRVDELSKGNDLSFFFLLKESKVKQTIFRIGRNFGIKELNKYLDKGWKVIDIYYFDEELLYLCQETTLKEERKEKLEKIEKINEKRVEK